MTAVEHLKAKPITASVVAGLLASLCCGGSLIFASVGLGAVYSALGLSRYTPPALAAGAILILAINYLFYRHAANQENAGHASVFFRHRMLLHRVIEWVDFSPIFQSLA